MSHALRSSLILSLALAAAGAAAQPADTEGTTPAMSQCAIDSLKPSPPFRAAARQDVAEAVNRANTCVGQKDAACGETAVASVQTLTLSDDERGLLAITRAELAMLREDSATAVAIFREVRALPELSDPLQREITWRLALLHNSRAEFAETLRLSASIRERACYGRRTKSSTRSPSPRSNGGGMRRTSRTVFPWDTPASKRSWCSASSRATPRRNPPPERGPDGKYVLP